MEPLVFLVKPLSVSLLAWCCGRCVSNQRGVCDLFGRQIKWLTLAGARRRVRECSRRGREIRSAACRWCRGCVSSQLDGVYVSLAWCRQGGLAGGDCVSVLFFREEHQKIRIKKSKLAETALFPPPWCLGIEPLALPRQGPRQ